ncbi:FAD binding domain-containing protein [Clostridium pasteurianum]|uniref:Aerobic-type carbon monoxide dehydrogenase, middle subunit CoxM/CutM-like protein n=1 Tax=Clostridium pasteurianum BC1 TaxID=86416 RepID=R4K180_CLOPA|nr:FAD binding domain-containing protein [Clostridium pasteurianum]AGK95496.1 aerobic-type carbon monoxide dehydrogenase, middle subunit CoxM/CutM-like protein [Clostridium pasteurianum BC1]
MVDNENKKEIITYMPEDLQEALEILDKDEVIILAGGTDLMVRRKNSSGLIPRFDKDTLFVNNLKELKNIYKDDSYINIGAGCTLSQISDNSIIPDYIKIVISDFASLGIRNAATMVGNVCNASPAGDTLPLLYALNAKMLIKSIKKEKLVDIKDFITGPGRHILNKNEMVTEIKLPLEIFNKFYYKKVGTRKATAISKLSFMGLARINGDVIEDIRIAFGAVAAAAVKSDVIEKSIAGKTFKEIALNKDNIAAEYSNFITPIDDQRSNKEYRKKVSINLLVDFLEHLNI